MKSPHVDINGFAWLKQDFVPNIVMKFQIKFFFLKSSRNPTFIEAGSNKKRSLRLSMWLAYRRVAQLTNGGLWTPNKNDM